MKMTSIKSSNMTAASSSIIQEEQNQMHFSGTIFLGSPYCLIILFEEDDSMTQILFCVMRMMAFFSSDLISKIDIIIIPYHRQDQRVS